MNTLWSSRYAHRTKGMESSMVRELLKWAAKPDLISFAGGLPAPEVFPVEKFREATNRVLSESGPQSLQYSPTEGCSHLREMIAKQAARYGLKVQTENILITSGSQQALDLIGKIFLNPGDKILMEQPSYLGALQAWRIYQADFVGVPMDDEGMQVEPLEAAMRNGPKFIYALPNFQNPTGVTLSLQRRRRLVEVADHYGVPIIEDDPYGQLRFEGDHLPPISVLDAQGREDDPNRSNVIYMSTFSKTLAPGLRLGWVIAAAEVIQKLVQAKQGADLHTGTFVQMVAYEIARDGFIDTHIEHIRSVYSVRRDAILAALKKHMPGGVRWTTPEGGLFIWAFLPEEVDAAEILKEAIEQGVTFVPGRAFYTDGTGKNTMRLNFSNATPEKIDEGMGRLGRAVTRRLAAS
jgi:2-aminoadipate transaminase